MNPLDAEIRRMIAVDGPMPVAQFMTLCLSHPRHGYYSTRDPFGARGDFTTAPEISQMFGELIGLWAAALWQQMREPPAIRLVELGPGRGTLMADALRATKIVHAFHAALSVHLVETSPVLRRRQRQMLAGFEREIAWHGDAAEVPEGPAIFIANEFVDALPVHQAVKAGDGHWHERMIGIGDRGKLAFALDPDPLIGLERMLPVPLRHARKGSLYEWRDDRFVAEISRRLVHSGGAALIIDYGHCEAGVGETLQAVGGHHFVDVLKAPGEVDLTAHVDFAALARTASACGARVLGPLPQGVFLRRLGIEHRAAKLKDGATVSHRAGIDAALMRLTGAGPDRMGELFKALAIADPALGPVAGFDS